MRLHKEPEPEDEASELEVCVVGPRGDAAFYDPADLEFVPMRGHGSSPTQAPPKCIGPSTAQTLVQKPEDSSFYQLKFAGSFVPRSFGPGDMNA